MKNFGDVFQLSQGGGPALPGIALRLILCNKTREGMPAWTRALGRSAAAIGTIDFLEPIMFVELLKTKCLTLSERSLVS